MPTVSKIRIYPIKSLDGQDVEHTHLLPRGPIAWDRAYHLVDRQNAIVTGKRFPVVHRLRSRVDLSTGCIQLRDQSDKGLGDARFDLDAQRAELLAWLADFFGFPVDLQEDHEIGCPDDLESPGPTLIGAATLAEVARWFDLPLDDVRARFRANIEIDGVPAFWEDRLFGPGETSVRFAIGGAQFDGVNPCLRCAVPTRDPRTGVPYPGFFRRFTDARLETLPAWAPPDRFENPFRLAVNTRLAEGGCGGMIHVGDTLRLGATLDLVG